MNALRASLVSLLFFGFAVERARPDLIDINELDGQPSIGLTNLEWDINVVNYTYREPLGNPYNENCMEVKFYDLYSSSAPSFGSLPSDWTANASAGSSSNLWNVTISCSDSLSFIAPGSYLTFSFITYRPTTNDTVLVGDRYGQGMLEAHGLRPPSPGDVFQGPTGLVPAPTQVGDVALSNGMVCMTISNLTVGVTNRIERTFDLAATNDWALVTNIVGVGGSTNWAEDSGSEWTNAFYRVKSVR